MPAIIRATASNGCPVEVEADAVISLSPDRSNADRTLLHLPDAVVTADGRFEDWMDRFARDWTGHT